jgi:hypothetical protein
VSTSQNGSLRWVSEFFEVRAQVDRDLTTISCFDRLLGSIKNLGRHSAVQQWLHLFDEERHRAIEVELRKLLEAGFIK